MKKYSWYLGSMVLALSLFACKADVTSESVTVQPIFESKSDKSPAHQSLGKPGASVSLKTPQPLLLNTAGVKDVILQLVSPVHQGTMSVSVRGQDDVTIVSAIKEFEFSLAEQGEYQLPLTLNIATEGRHYVQLQVTIHTEEQVLVRAIAVIIQVGKPAIKIKKMAIDQSAEAGEQVISLPAQETISPR